MPYKVEAVVKFNDREALVLDKFPRVKYERHGGYLFGIDEYGVFVNVYYYEEPSGRFQAFAGHEFDIPMVDGTVTKAKGQWWDGGADALATFLGGKIIRVIIRAIKDLQECYVFSGLWADKIEYEKLRRAYTGKVYEYREYEKLICNEEICNNEERN